MLLLKPKYLSTKKDCIKWHSLFLLIFLWATDLGAQEIYDLERCVTTGLEQNFTVKVARNNAQMADNNVTIGNAGFLPTLSASGRLGGNVNSTVQNMNDDTKKETSGVHNTTGSAGINFSMPLFRGFNVQTSWQKLHELNRMGELNVQMSMENLVAQIVSEYYYYIQQLNYQNNMKYAVSLSRERVRIDEERYLLGSSSKLELLQSVVYLNADSSRLARQNEAILESEVRLKKLMALENIEENIQVADTSIAVNPNLLYAELLEMTLVRNTGLQMAKKNQLISELDYKIIASRSYPYLNLTSGYNYGYRGYGSGTLGDYGERSLKNQHNRTFDYGITLGMDIFDGFNRRREKANATIEIENKVHRYQEVEQDIKAELLTIYYAYENNLRLLQLEEQNLGVARENLEIAMERYRLGALSGLELREVQKSLLDAEERLISVKFQTKLAEISLLQMAGKIMDYV
ncbi:Outer membrane protein TolC [Saccharicrinis carchari]|uniref:Outer membrane protein TolC n=1 Tax=Saccharicrinis carchari TaxID=1168039 RepID=A0A521BE10_SACCC|nr:TolC family protein [Saccharicrinis carchari]SMO45337.1 Outer membrane protein TolC [Saccharicrinis carchari]